MLPRLSKRQIISIYFQETTWKRKKSRTCCNDDGINYNYRHETETDKTAKTFVSSHRRFVVSRPFSFKTCPSEFQMEFSNNENQHGGPGWHKKGLVFDVCPVKDGLVLSSSVHNSQAWVGMVPFSLIKNVQRAQTLLWKRDRDRGQCASALFVTRHCRCRHVTLVAGPPVSAHTHSRHMDALSHSGGAWGISWHAVYFTSKSWGGDENIWVSEDINLTKSYGAPLHVFYAALQPIVLEISPLAVSWRQTLPSFNPLCCYYSNKCQENRFSGIFVISRAAEAKMSGSRGWLLAWEARNVSLKTSEQQLNKKARRLPMCLHRS